MTFFFWRALKIQGRIIQSIIMVRQPWLPFLIPGEH